MYTGSALKKRRSTRYMAVATLVVITIILIAYSLACPVIHEEINREDTNRRIVANLKTYIAGVESDMEMRSRI